MTVNNLVIICPGSIKTHMFWLQIVYPALIASLYLRIFHMDSLSFIAKLKVIKPSVILHSDIYLEGLQFRRISPVVQNHLDTLPTISKISMLLYPNM